MEVTNPWWDRGGSRGRVQGVRTPPPPPWDDLRFSNTTGILQKKNYVVYPGAEVEQQTSAPPPKKNPGFAPVGDHDLNSHIIKALTDFQC